MQVAEPEQVSFQSTLPFPSGIQTDRVQKRAHFEDQTDRPSSLMISAPPDRHASSSSLWYCPGKYLQAPNGDHQDDGCVRQDERCAIGLGHEVDVAHEDAPLLVERYSFRGVLPR